MSIVPKETIEVIAQSIGINNLSEDASLALAPDAEYRMREIMQDWMFDKKGTRKTNVIFFSSEAIAALVENFGRLFVAQPVSAGKEEAIKCMLHSKRTILTADDVDCALTLRNVEPIYGFSSGGPLRFKRAVGHRDLFYIDDKDVDFKDVIEAPLPRAPLDTAVLCHWLAIEGVQPAIPENAPVKVITAPSDSKDYEQKDGTPVDLRLPVKHILSRELQLYFQKITELTVGKSDPVLFKEALLSLATDSGLHPLVPYFTNFIAEEVSRGLNDYALLFALMRVVRSLLHNPHIHIEPYLHQLMPSVVTCLVSKKLGNRIADNHWELRDFAANLVALICKRFGHVYHSLQARLTKTLINAFLDPKRALTQHYGAIQGLAALGPNMVRLLILPNLEPYLQLLEKDLLLEKQRNEMKRHEAWQVYGALLRAAGQCIYDRLKIFPALPSPPAHTVWGRKQKVVTALPKKRKASTDPLEEEPPSQKFANDGSVGAMSTNSSPSHMQVDAIAPAQSGDPDVGRASSSGQIPDDNKSDGRDRKDKEDSQALKMSAILTQIWKDDLNSGRVLVSQFELFGDRIFSFIPAPEMSIFL